MSRRFSMTSNPVRASESQDEAEPLLGDAERKCDDVVEAIGFGNWSLLLVVLLGFLFMGDSIEATLLSFLYDCVGGAFLLEATTCVEINRERKQHTFRDDRADHNGGAERAGDVDAARDDGGETQLILMFAVRTTLPPSPRRPRAGEGAGPLNSAAAGPVGASSAAR
jgi:hypothetical protein